MKVTPGRLVVGCTFLLGFLGLPAPVAAQVTPGASKVISSAGASSQSPLITFHPGTGQYSITYRETGLRRWVGAFLDQSGNRVAGPFLLLNDNNNFTPIPRDLVPFPFSTASLQTFEAYDYDAFGNNVFVGDAAGVAFVNNGTVSGLINYTNNGNDKFVANNCGEHEELSASTVDPVTNKFFTSYSQSFHLYSNGQCKTTGSTLMAGYHQNGAPFTFLNGPFPIENGAFATDAAFNPATGQVWLAYVSATVGRLNVSLLTPSGVAATFNVTPGADGMTRGQMRLAVHPTSNNVLAVWNENNGSQWMVKGRLFAPNGAPLTAEIALSNPATEMVFRNYVAATADNFLVVGTLANHIIGRVLSPAGSIASEWTRIDHFKDQFNQDVNFYNGLGLVANPTRGTYAVVGDSFSDIFFTEVSATAGTPLTVAIGGTGTGSVTSSPAGINCPGACATSQPPGTTVDLTATPGAYSNFTGWSGACSGTGACSVTLDTPKSVTATFTKQRFTLSVTTIGTGAVISAPAGINCGSTCVSDFDAQTHVSLTATPEPGSRFAGWSGACTGISACDVDILAATSVTATFVKQVTLTVSVNGNGGGAIDGSGIACPATCAITVDAGSSVSLSASADTTSRFTGWSGACSGVATCNMILTNDTAVTGSFVRQFDVQVSVNGSGSVSSSPAGIACGSTCTSRYDTGASVTLSATPAAGWRFSGWTGSAGCSGATCVLTSPDYAVLTATATFVEQFALTVALGGNGGGSVTGAGIACPGDCAESYDGNTIVTLSATPNGTSDFTGWSGACTGTGACTVTMSAAQSVVATFTSNLATIPSVSSAIAALAPTIGSGSVNSLSGKLSSAQSSIARGNRAAASNQLNAAINEIQALVRSRRLDAATAATLIAGLQQIIAAL